MCQITYLTLEIVFFNLFKILKYLNWLLWFSTECICKRWERDGDLVLGLIQLLLMTQPTQENAPHFNHNLSDLDWD